MRTGKGTGRSAQIARDRVRAANAGEAVNAGVITQQEAATDLALGKNAKDWAYFATHPLETPPASLHLPTDRIGQPFQTKHMILDELVKGTYGTGMIIQMSPDVFPWSRAPPDEFPVMEVTTGIDLTTLIPAWNANVTTPLVKTKLTNRKSPFDAVQFAYTSTSKLQTQMTLCGWAATLEAGEMAKGYVKIEFRLPNEFNVQGSTINGLLSSLPPECRRVSYHEIKTSHNHVFDDTIADIFKSTLTSTTLNGTIGLISGENTANYGKGNVPPPLAGWLNPDLTYIFFPPLTLATTQPNFQLRFELGAMFSYRTQFSIGDVTHDPVPDAQASAVIKAHADFHRGVRGTTTRVPAIHPGKHPMAAVADPHRTSKSNLFSNISSFILKHGSHTMTKLHDGAKKVIQVGKVAAPIMAAIASGAKTVGSLIPAA